MNSPTHGLADAALTALAAEDFESVRNALQNIKAMETQWADTPGLGDVEELVTYIEESDGIESVGRVTNPPAKPENDHDHAMPSREVVKIDCTAGRAISYKMSAALRSFGFVHEYTDTRLTGSKYNPQRAVQQWWSRPVSLADEDEDEGEGDGDE